MSGWSNSKQQALKILGDGAEVPDMSSQIEKASSDWAKAYEAFKGVRDELQAKLLDLDNSSSALINAMQQFRAKIEKNDFNLDSKKDAKKIQQAQKLLLAVLDDAIQHNKVNDKNIDELNRHLAQLGKYKPSASPI